MDITDKLYSYNPRSIVFYGILVSLAIFLSHNGVVEYQSDTLEFQRWVIAGIGFLANFGIVYHHMTVPPHPKFLLVTKRKIKMRKILFGVLITLVILFSFKYCNTKKEDKIVLQESSVLIQEQIKNVGNEDLILKEVKKTCGCTATKVDKDIIKPGEVAKVNVTMTISGNHRKTKYITIVTNDPKTPNKRVKITADVFENLYYK